MGLCPSMECPLNLHHDLMKKKAALKNKRIVLRSLCEDCLCADYSLKIPAQYTAYIAEWDDKKVPISGERRIICINGYFNLRENENFYALYEFHYWGRNFEGLRFVLCRFIRAESSFLDSVKAGAITISVEVLKVYTRSELAGRKDIPSMFTGIPYYMIPRDDMILDFLYGHSWSWEGYDICGAFGEQWHIYTDNKRVDHVLLYKEGSMDERPPHRIVNLVLGDRSERRRNKLCWLAYTEDERFEYGPSTYHVFITRYLKDETRDLIIPGEWRLMFPLNKPFYATDTPDHYVYEYNCCIKIAEGAFRNCSILENVILPENVSEIEPYAFRNCRNLKRVYIPKECLIHHLRL